MVVVLLTAAILTVSALGLLAVAAPVGTHVPAGGLSIGARTPATPSAPSGRTFGSIPAQASPASSSPLVQHAMAAARAAGPDGRLMSLPHPPATAAQQAQARAQGYITPFYSSGAPAPMGISDYGLRNGTGGSVVPYYLNTTELQGNFTVFGAGLQSPTDTYFTNPGGYSVQQNAWLTNVTIWGNDTFDYWTQDTIYYNQILGQGTLVSDTWNYTTVDSTLPTNSIIAHGPDGSIESPNVYFTVGPTFSLAYPFSITFTMDSLKNPTHGGEEELQYNALITRGASVLYNYSNWDYVVFNSTGGSSPAISHPSNFSAQGYTYNSIGGADDFELDVGGPGGGSQTDLLSANAELQLHYLNASSDKLQSVPSAYNYGGETGETVTGASVSWQGTPGQQVAVMTTGPSILGGLWDASGQPGTEAVTLDVSPANAWVFVYPTTSTNFSNTFPEWAPLVDTTTIYLSPDVSYAFVAGLSNYDPASSASGVLTTAQTWTVTLTPDATQGIYTPLWAWGNAQLPSISSGGTGTPSDPYIIDNDQSAPIDSIFGVLNDWTFPVFFAGLYLMNTTASVEVIDAAPFSVAVPYLYVPATNSMPLWFWQASNVAIVDSVLPGTWYFPYLDVYYFFEDIETPSQISFWNSSHNLVADNLIDYTVEGIYLYGGTDNTLWGNTIVAVTPAPTEAPVPPAQTPLNGITEAESGDLIYNNAFLDPYSYFPLLAQEYEFNDFTDLAEMNANTWNVTPEAASVVAYAPGFSQVPLVGSIADTSWQGGNFWADYGLSFNPYGVPYDEDGFIALGNDSAPLPPGSLVGNVSAVEFTESGLPAGTYWSVTVDGWEITSWTNEISFFLTNGSYEYTVGVVAESTASPASGSPLVSGVAQTIPIIFTSTSGTISGTVTPATATLTVDGTPATVTDGAFSVSATPGVHSVVASASGYVTYRNNVSVSGGATTPLTIVLASTSVTGYFAGTVSPASATLSVDGHTETIVSGAFNITLAVGFHAVEVTASGYLPYVALVDVTGGTTTSQTIVLTASSSTTPSSTYLSPLAYGLIGLLAVLVIIFLIIAATRGRRSSPPAQAWTSPPQTGNPPSDPPTSGS